MDQPQVGRDAGSDRGAVAANPTELFRRGLWFTECSDGPQP
jgi:hypothetical protein